MGLIVFIIFFNFNSNTLRMVPLGFFMSDVFELGLQVSQLKLTDAEIALYNAILIMNPGKAGVFFLFY